MPFSVVSSPIGEPMDTGGVADAACVGSTWHKLESARRVRVGSRCDSVKQFRLLP